MILPCVRTYGAEKVEDVGLYNLCTLDRHQNMLIFVDTIPSEGMCMLSTMMSMSDVSDVYVWIHNMFCSENAIWWEWLRCEW